MTKHDLRHMVAALLLTTSTIAHAAPQDPVARAVAIKSVEQAIYSGRYDEVRDAVEIVSLYERVARQCDKWPREMCFPAAMDFIQDVNAELANPMAAALDDARYAERIALLSLTKYLGGNCRILLRTPTRNAQSTDHPTFVDDWYASANCYDFVG